MHGDQGAGCQPAADLVRGNADAQKLAARYDTVPHSGQLAKDRLDCPAALVHSTT
jgi:hypothetical protein